MDQIKLDYVSIGRRIKTKRLEKGLTQEQLGEMVNLSIPHISHIENGSTKLSFESFINISNALQVSADELLQDNLMYNDLFYLNEISAIMEDCSTAEMKDLTRLVQYFKEFFRSKEEI